MILPVTADREVQSIAGATWLLWGTITLKRLSSIQGREREWNARLPCILFPPSPGFCVASSRQNCSEEAERWLWGEGKNGLPRERGGKEHKAVLHSPSLPKADVAAPFPGPPSAAPPFPMPHQARES